VKKIPAMKRECLFAALLLLTLISYSQKDTTKTVDPTDPNIQKELTKIPRRVSLDTLTFDELNQYRNQAVRLRNTGRVLTLGGVGILATSFFVGIIMMNTSDNDSNGEDMNNLIPGFSVMCIGGLFGIPCTAIGIPAWTAGGRRKVKAELALKKFNIVQENSMAVGLGIKISF
jgi:hypothetical protein